MAVRPESVVVDSVSFEHGGVVLGLDTPSPRLSWRVRTNDASWSQTKYEVELDGDSVVRVESDDQVLVPWPFEPLRSRQRASVRVRVALNDVWSAWSKSSVIEVGLLDAHDWSARFISPRTFGGLDKPAPFLSCPFVLGAGVRKARLYITAHGVYEAAVNGHRVGEDVLAPGWSSYPKILNYQTYDVTPLLCEGENEFEVLLGNGWYRGGPGRVFAQFFEDGRSSVYGDRLALLAQLEVMYDDGSVQFMTTDEQWVARESGILENDLYNGQRIDLRVQDKATAGAVDVLEEDYGRLKPAVGPPVRVTQVVPPVKVWESESGSTLIDFGQNLVGWVRVRLYDTVEGAEVFVRHAEVLQNCELYTRPLGGAKATDSYVLAQSDEVVLEPSLTFHGFRFAEVTGVKDISITDVNAVVIGSDLKRTGWFSCSDPELERLHENVVWSARGNFLSVPTDCPQRSERLGWTGDIQVFAPTACFLFDVAAFLDSWLENLTADQYADGTVPQVVPNVFETASLGAGWGDAATVIPWVLYQRFGDTRILARQFDSMRAWVDKVASLISDGVWAGGFQFGDWLDPSAPADDPSWAQADPDVVATAYLVRSADILAQSAGLLGRTEDAQRYGSLAKRTREAFAHAYVTGQGRVASDAPTCYALAIEWALLPSDTQRKFAADKLADLVRVNGYRMTTGFLGTPLICDALCSADHPHLAYRLLLERECPSWLYPVTIGATTVWERWDSMLPDGSVNPASMVSFNHYAYGAVADWMHRTVAGLAPASPGYREITVRPIPDPSLTHASARHITPYGEAVVAWRRENEEFQLDVTVPVGARANVYLPGNDPVEVSHGQYSWSIDDPCTNFRESVSTVRDLIDTPELWHRVASAYVESGVCKDAVAVARKFAGQLDAPVAVVFPPLVGTHQPLIDLRRSLQKILT